MPTTAEDRHHHRFLPQFYSDICLYPSFQSKEDRHSLHPLLNQVKYFHSFEGYIGHSRQDLFILILNVYFVLFFAFLMPTPLQICSKLSLLLWNTFSFFIDDHAQPPSSATLSLSSYFCNTTQIILTFLYYTQQIAIPKEQQSKIHKCHRRASPSHVCTV